MMSSARPVIADAAPAVVAGQVAGVEPAVLVEAGGVQLRAAVVAEALRRAAHPQHAHALASPGIGSIRSSMPEIGLPSLCAAQSSGSSGRLMVTGPFSVMPHREYRRTPKTSRTSST